MAVHNGERFLREAVESVLSQSLSDFEFVIVDDGSTDDTGAILAEYAAADGRIVVHRQNNAGVAEARNRGLAVASAPLVANVDADDVALPTRLEQQVGFMRRHPDVGVVGGAVAFVDEDGRKFGEWRYPLTDGEIRRAFPSTTPLVQPATMVRKDTVLSAGLYRGLLAPAEDLDLWLRISDRQRLANLPELMISYRVHPNQATVRSCEAGALGALAARVAARARAEGRPDPVDAIDRVDFETLRLIGASDHEIASAVVGNMAWVARTVGRAGYTAESERLFREAGRRAERQAPELAADVHRQHARLLREQRRRLPFALESLRAARAGFAGRRRR